MVKEVTEPKIFEGSNDPFLLSKKFKIKKEWKVLNRQFKEEIDAVGKK